MLLCKANDFVEKKTELDSPYHEWCDSRTLGQGRILLAAPRVSNHRKAGTVNFSFKANPNFQFLLNFFSASIKKQLIVFSNSFELTVLCKHSDYSLPL